MKPHTGDDDCECPSCQVHPPHLAPRGFHPQPDITDAWLALGPDWMMWHDAVQALESGQTIWRPIWVPHPMVTGEDPMRYVQQGIWSNVAPPRVAPPQDDPRAFVLTLDRALMVRRILNRDLQAPILASDLAAWWAVKPPDPKE